MIFWGLFLYCTSTVLSLYLCKREKDGQNAFYSFLPIFNTFIALVWILILLAEGPYGKLVKWIEK